jgi:hypothetical protein
VIALRSIWKLIVAANCQQPMWVRLGIKFFF